MTADLDISVLIATHNRADTLRETLEALVAVRRDALAVVLRRQGIQVPDGANQECP